jgi:hypothetical protein
MFQQDTCQVSAFDCYLWERMEFICTVATACHLVLSALARSTFWTVEWQDWQWMSDRKIDYCSTFDDAKLQSELDNSVSPTILKGENQNRSKL